MLFQTNIWNLPGKPLDEARFGVRDYNVDYGLRGTAGWEERLKKFESKGVDVAYSGPSYLCVGGKSNIWSGTILQLRPWELNEWPSEIVEALPGYYQQARRILNSTVSLGPFQEKLLARMQGKIGHDYQIETLTRAREQVNLRIEPVESGDTKYCLSDVTRGSSGLYSTTSALLEFLSNSRCSQNLTVNANHLVDTLTQKGRMIDGVKCYDLVGGRWRVYEGKVVVLAAGGIASAAIAKRSKLNDKSGRLGHGLTDHPHYKYQVIDEQNSGVDFPKLPIPVTFDNHAKLLFSPRNASATSYPCNQQMLINYDYWDFLSLDDLSWEEKYKQYSKGGPKGRKTVD